MGAEGTISAWSFQLALSAPPQDRAPDEVGGPPWDL